MLVYAVYNEFTANYEQVYLFSNHEPTFLIIQDFLSMTALELSYAYLKMKESRDVDMLAQSIKELDENLGGYLKND